MRSGPRLSRGPQRTVEARRRVTAAVEEDEAEKRARFEFAMAAIWG